MKNRTKNLLIGSGSLVAAFTLAGAGYAVSDMPVEKIVAATALIFSCSLLPSLMGYFVGLVLDDKNPYSQRNATMGTIYGGAIGLAIGAVLAGTVLNDDYPTPAPVETPPAVSAPYAP